MALATSRKLKTSKSSASQLLLQAHQAAQQKAQARKRRRKRQKRRLSETPMEMKSRDLFPPTCFTIITDALSSALSIQVSQYNLFGQFTDFEVRFGRLVAD